MTNRLYISNNMPSNVRVKILAARDLPVMDRTSDLTDAFAEVSLCSRNV